MRTIRINRYRVTKRALAEAEAVLKNGGTVVFPTETAYGLAADPRQSLALRKIFLIKGRSVAKQLPFIASSVSQVKHFFSINKRLFELAAKHWPGPLTLVLDTEKMPFRQWPDAAVRVPSSAWSRALAEANGCPITSTSANLSGHQPCYSGAKVRREFANRKELPELLLDAGPLPKRSASTIVKLVNGRLKVLRPGPIKVE